MCNNQTTERHSAEYRSRLIYAQVIQDVKKGGYKYLGMPDVDQIKQDEMKDKLRMDYFRQVKRVLRTKLNGGNTISAINIMGSIAGAYTVKIVKTGGWTYELVS